MSEYKTEAPDKTPDGRPCIRTFDIFDTLIARRCVQAVDIFCQIEAKSGIKDFASIRRQAEQNVMHAPHDLNTIYTEIARLMGTTPRALDPVKRMEIDIEHDNIIPILENIAQVRHGDLLLSDMYLNKEQILSLLDKAGYQRKTGLIVSNSGKKDGYIWPEISSKIKIEQHLGDNSHSDIEMPRRFNIPAVHTKISEPSPIEDIFIKIGAPQLGQLCRELRLRTWNANQDLRTVQLIQANLNFPLFLLASIALARAAEKLNKRSILFSSRDCEMWLPLFTEISRRLGLTFDSIYFYTSRLTKINPSHDYLEYGRHLITQDALVVDICGTGWSISHFLKKLDLHNVPVLMLHKLPAAAAYEATAETAQSCTFYSIVNQDRTDFSNTLLEMCNYSDHTMVTDVILSKENVIPVLSKETRSAHELDCINCQKDVFNLGISLLKDHYNICDILSLDMNSIVQLCEFLYSELSKQKVLRNIYGKSHTSEENEIRKMILTA
ncbi:hypothetical protein [Acetobacter sp. LMG 32666]|uniref:hypothetical protein n=1 Tax=Acetobacter sp. LMG 32666 TaxID=2959295 RepID=UPI0030C7DB70